MGGSSSKVGRTLPTKARSSGHESQGSSPVYPPSPQRLATGPKSEGDLEFFACTIGVDILERAAVERDGKDPHLLANLSRIGQVDIHSAATTTRTTNQVSEIYRTRHVAEQQAASTRPVRNRLGASTLSALLDDRKFVTSQSDLDQLAARYTVDVSVLERLARFVNSPSIGEGTVVRTVSDDGQEKITMQAVWTEPTMIDKASTS